MRKVIIILTGISDGKTKFTNTIKEHNYWTWNINHRNFLSSVTYGLFWDGNRNDQYYEFIKQFEALADKYFNFKWLYAKRLIEKFQKNDKTTVFVIHSADDEMIKSLLRKYDNCYDVHITNNDQNYDAYRVFNYENEAYVEEILDFMKELTKEKEIE